MRPILAVHGEGGSSHCGAWVKEEKGTIQSACHLGVADARLHTGLRHSAVWRLINLEPIYGRSSWWQRTQQEGQGKSYPLGPDPPFSEWEAVGTSLLLQRSCWRSRHHRRLGATAPGAFGSSAKRMVPLAGRCSVKRNTGCAAKNLSACAAEMIAGSPYSQLLLHRWLLHCHRASARLPLLITRRNLSLRTDTFWRDEFGTRTMLIRTHAQSLGNMLGEEPSSQLET